MKQVINIYKKHKVTIENFITTVIKSLPNNYIENTSVVFKKNPFFQVIYTVDSEFKQVSPTFIRKGNEVESKGNDKKHYFTKLNLSEDGFYLSNPYIHYRTGKVSISIVHFLDGVYYIFDCNLIELLEELKLIEYNSVHDKFKKSIYFLGSCLLALVAIVLIVYGGYVLIALLFSPSNDEFLNEVFKSIISITLGLAMYDLAKQIFEHEVLFHSFNHAENKQYMMLSKFLISIVIALSIETLMVVFKLALKDPTQMLSAFYLMVGTTIMFVGLAYFYKTIKTSHNKEEDS